MDLRQLKRGWTVPHLAAEVSRRAPAASDFRHDGGRRYRDELRWQVIAHLGGGYGQHHLDPRCQRRPPAFVPKETRSGRCSRGTVVSSITRCRAEKTGPICGPENWKPAKLSG